MRIICVQHETRLLTTMTAKPRHTTQEETCITSCIGHREKPEAMKVSDAVLPNYWQSHFKLRLFSQYLFYIEHD